VASVDAHLEVFEQPDVTPAAAAPVVAGERDEVEVVDDRQPPGQVGDKDDRGLQRGDEDRLAALVVGGDLRAELRNPGRDLLRGEVGLADPRIG
jgi:hypothetical protein